MIQRLRLTNWRAYDELDVELGPGATFVVASNGIGKTSLVMGAAWAVFGDVAGISAVDEIRGDAEEAAAAIDLRLPGGGTIAITRRIDRRGRTSVEAQTGGREITDQETLDALLTAEFGADVRVLAQLTFMIHGGLHETQGEFELRDHLAEIFGVAPLYAAAAGADALAAETAATIRRTKLVERKDARQKDEIVAELEAADTELRTLNEARDAAVATLNQASDRLRAAEEWTSYHRALAERQGKLAAYADVAASLLDREVDPDNVVDALTQWEADEERAIAEMDTDLAAARGRADAIRESLDKLGSSDAICPTCLRPLAEHEAAHAAQEHSASLEAISSTIADAQGRIAAQRGVLENLKRILADIRSVGVPVEPSSPDASGKLDPFKATHDQARDEVQRLDQEIALRSAAAQVTRETLEALEADDARIAELEHLFRQEAIALAAAKTFRETAARIMEQHVEPLVEEVARRWKQAFGRGGLQLSADGKITRRIGSRTLSFSALSGGERVWALLVARLLVAGASTRAPFVWLDEPLEHLDPRLRRIVAGTLALASSRSGIRQVIVTTYEAPIAQQLMEDVPSASLVYVTSAE